MNKFFVTLVAALAMAFASPAFAQDCVPSTSEAEVDAAGYYVDNDPCQPDCSFSIWIYQESNDIEGLQRGDEVKDDTCGGAIESDIIVL